MQKKKSNSLEELRSCTELDEDDKPDSSVTFRSKGGRKSANTILCTNSSSDIKEKTEKLQKFKNIFEKYS